MTRIVLLLVALAVCGACVNQNLKQARQAASQWDQSLAGMRGASEDEILAMAGAPDSSQEVGSYVVWRYERGYGEQRAQQAPGGAVLERRRFVVIDVYFEDGVVVKHTVRVD